MPTSRIEANEVSMEAGDSYQEYLPVAIVATNYLTDYVYPHIVQALNK